MKTPVSPKKRAAILDLKGRGWSVDGIAEAVGLGTSTVYRVLAEFAADAKQAKADRLKLHKALDRSA